MKIEKIVIYGNTPATYTAAIYAATANLSPIIIEPTEKYNSILNTDKVVGYHGSDFVGDCRQQALNFKVRLINSYINDVDIYDDFVFIKELDLKTRVLVVDQVIERISDKSEKVGFKDKSDKVDLKDKSKKVEFKVKSYKVDLKDKSEKVDLKDKYCVNNFKNLVFCGLSLGIKEAILNAASGCKAIIDAKNLIL
ncbi:Thioredoxin reductase [Dictyocoela muelleri]|nr:Thioredoxin reductase [Dictyocoela muelleri]